MKNDFGEELLDLGYQQKKDILDAYNDTGMSGIIDLLNISVSQS